MKSTNQETKKQIVTDKPELKPGQKQIDSRPDKDSGKVVIPPKPDDKGRKVLHG